MNSSYNPNLNPITTALTARRCEATRPVMANWGFVGAVDGLFILNQVRNHKDSRLGYREKPEKRS